MNLVFRAATADDADALSQLAMRSKAHWGYEPEFLDRVRDELTFSRGSIPARRITVAEAVATAGTAAACGTATATGAVGAMIGFYSIDGDPPDGELGNLWLDPASIGRGLGRRLWQHAVDAARDLGFTSLRIEADPHAEGFYLAMGAVRTGGAPSGSVPGRVLPLLRHDLAERVPPT